MSQARTGLASRLRPIILTACVTALVGCGHDQPLQPLPLQSQAPDFALTDVNPASTTHDQMVSPRSQVGRISAWYFSKAT